MRAFLCLLLLLPTTVLAWGRVGHEAICQVAYEHLEPVAQAEVDRLIAFDPDYDDFATSCTFADSPERIRAIEHYVNFSRNTRSVATLECPMAEACVLTAIPADAAILADPEKSDEERLLALKLLGHWVGDIHQPMHNAFADDAGANWIPNIGECERNLHATWDSCIIEKLISTDYQTVAILLSSDITPENRADWMHDGPVEWSNESFRIAIDPATRYCVSKEEACWYAADNFMLSPGETQRTMEISRSYLKRHQKTVELRLKQAGIRLAATINRAIEERNAPAPAEAD